MLFFPPREFFLRVLATSTFTTGLICVVLLTMMSLFILKIVLRASPSLTYNGVELGGIIVSFIQSIVMVVSYNIISLLPRALHMLRSST